MDLRRIDAAIAAYGARADAALDARLAFFRGVWGVMGQHEQAAAERGIPGLEAEDVRGCLQRGVPVLAERPAPVTPEALAAAVSDVAGRFAAHEGFAPSARELARSCDWAAFVDGLPVGEHAGSRPAAFLDATAQAAHERWGEDAGLMASVVLLGLRTQLAPVADRVTSLLAASARHDVAPRTCPVCGSEAAVASVGPAPSGKQNGRVLWCAQCGCSWEFERVRCARCGTRNQAHLHYVGIAGDAAHRAHCCDECGGYVRTRFVEALDRTPLCFEVEDVVMADLDAAAQAGLLR